MNGICERYEFLPQPNNAMTTFRQAIRKQEFVITAELNLARDPEQEGITICSELLQELSDVPGVSGAHLMTPGKLATIPAAILASGLRN